jgi:hypothetical protein
MSRADGIGGVVRAAAAQSLPAQPAVEQAELFNLPIAKRYGETDAAFAERRERLQEEAKRGRGRPKGAQSVSTTEWRNFALKHGPHPVVAMMRWLDLGPHGLSEELRIPLKEGFDRWAVLARELAPYFMAKQAPVDDQGKAVPGVAVIVGNAGLNTEAGGVPPWRVAFQTADGEIIDMDDAPAPAEAAPHAQAAEGGGAS